jgi:hypothetical protein
VSKNGKKSGRTEPFVMLPRSLVASASWQSLGLPARRLIDFLMLEHMRHGGRNNGFLTAPRKQLAEAGIHHDAVSRAINEAIALGLIDCIRGTGRAPNRYALTWLPLANGVEPTNRWRQCNEQAANAVSARKQARTRALNRRTPVSAN